MPRWLAALVLAGMTGCQEAGSPMSSSSQEPPTFVELVIPPRAGTGTPPLLVLLHGIGADEHDLAGLAPALDARFETVSLRAQRSYHVGFSWFDIAFRPGGEVVPDLQQARAALDDLSRWLRAAPARLGTDPQRTYVLGFSQGAMMSVGLLHQVPDVLAGVVALSGRFPGDVFGSPAPALKDVPVFVGHGALDDVLPIDNGRRLRDALTPLVRELDYHEYRVGHGISDAELADVATWLAARLAAPPRQ